MPAMTKFSAIIFALYLLMLLAPWGSILPRTRRRNAAKSALAAYRQGDYEAALKETEGLRTDPIQYSFLRGGLLMRLGRLDEAEKLLRQSLTLCEQREAAIRARNTGEEAVELDKQIKATAFRSASLGELHLERGRYNQALECFQASARSSPGYGPFHRSIAETWLRRGADPTEALKWATLAVEEDRAAKAVSRDIGDMNLGEDLATLAWAVAVESKDREKVDRLVREAISLAGTQSVGTTAQVHYYAGRAYAALGDSGLAALHLKEAAGVDQFGRWGRAARAADPSG
jgi:tetratricopeptide (TPR) repeat protein